jgi:hypothetical protein
VILTKKVTIHRGRSGRLWLYFCGGAVRANEIFYSKLEVTEIVFSISDSHVDYFYTNITTSNTLAIGRDNSEGKG